MKSQLTGEPMDLCEDRDCLWFGRYHVAPCRPSDWAFRRHQSSETDYGNEKVKEFLEKHDKGKR